MVQVYFHILDNCTYKKQRTVDMHGGISGWCVMLSKNVFQMHIAFWCNNLKFLPQTINCLWNPLRSGFLNHNVFNNILLRLLKRSMNKIHTTHKIAPKYHCNPTLDFKSSDYNVNLHDNWLENNSEKSCKYITLEALRFKCTSVGHLRLGSTQESNT